MPPALDLVTALSSDPDATEPGAFLWQSSEHPLEVGDLVEVLAPDGRLVAMLRVDDAAANGARLSLVVVEVDL